MDGAALLFLAASQVSPLEDTSGALGLTLFDTAKHIECSEGAVSRYLAGSRATTPLVLFVLLGNRDLRVWREQWIERPRGAVTSEMVAKLPAGLSIERAKEAAARAIADLMGGAR